MQDVTSAATTAAADPTVRPHPAEPTPLAAALGGPSAAFEELAGALSYPVFSVAAQEIDALTRGAGAFDLGWRAQIAVGGSDRLRWLNGMLTGNIQGLAAGEGCYNFVLNAQGRIQGDADAYRMEDHLLVVTDRGQATGLMEHFDRFIIMDDVAIEDITPTRTALGLAGPLAGTLLASLGVELPAGNASSALWLLETRICGVPVQLTGGHPGPVPRLELWCANQGVATLWQVLLAAGAAPCGLRSQESLRILAGIPRYGVDVTARDLPQETGQMRALHFAKGCYLGQEIVERIRSRGQVHRRLLGFLLSAPPATLPVEATLPGETAPAARVTSATTYQGACYGLGMARTEAVEPPRALDLPGGTATPLTRSPLSIS